MAPKLIFPLAAQTQCIYTNGASPATNVTVDIGTDVASVPTAALAATIVTRLIAANGTHGNSTSTTSRVVVDGNPGYTTLISGPGFGGAQVHLETVACWKDQTTVTVTVGNGPVGAAMVLAKLVASKIF